MAILKAHWPVLCCSLVLATVAGCHSATPQEQMQSAQNDLIGEEMALQQCQAQNGYDSEKCAGERSAYNHDLAAFRAKYGR
jgi:hypothetical protein